MKRICVFCGSSRGTDPVYAGAAASVGALLARLGIGVVYGGGRVGLMGTLADAALAAGGEVIGVIPESIVALEVAHGGLADLRVVGSMHERKALMADLSDGFIALPGGYGTLDEFCEVLTWAQLGLHGKPCGLLNIAGFYDHFLQHLDHCVDQGLLRPEHRALVLEDTAPERLLDRMAAYQAPPVPKWLNRDEV
jgi:uncharacterized protein (TIGR00730 family)